jgi:hypothetical protein
MSTTISTIQTTADTAVSTKFALEESKIRDANRKQTEKFMQRIQKMLLQPESDKVREILTPPVENFLNKLRERHDTGRGITNSERQKIRAFINTTVEWSNAILRMGFCFDTTDEAGILETLDYNDSEIDKKIRSDIILNDATNEFIKDKVNRSNLPQATKKLFFNGITDKEIVKENKKIMMDFLKSVNHHPQSDARKQASEYIEYILKHINGSETFYDFFRWSYIKNMASKYHKMMQTDD